MSYYFAGGWGVCFGAHAAQRHSIVFHLASPIVAGECPNDCSGNGECKLIGDLADVLTIPYSNTNWDVDRIQTCVCDNGFFGPDCSQRECSHIWRDEVRRRVATKLRSRAHKSTH